MTFSPASPIVELKSVFFSYNQKPVLDDVNLTIMPREFASIIGPNGGGKTTLIRLILGLLSPQQGNVRLFGDKPEKTRLRVGYTTQTPRFDFRFPISVLDVVLMGRLGSSSQAFCRLNSAEIDPAKANSPGTDSPEIGSAETDSAGLNIGKRDSAEPIVSNAFSSSRVSPNHSFLSRLFFRYNRNDHQQAQEALQKMNVWEIRHKMFGDLSGGERQRVLIARSLCSNPDLLILDEPTNNIDPSNTEILYNLLDELNKSIAILIVSHDIGVVSHYVQSVICVNRHVWVHPTSSFNGTMMRDIYGSDIRLVRHDHRCSEHGHTHCADSNPRD